MDQIKQNSDSPNAKLKKNKKETKINTLVEASLS